jgi:IclR family acetate operon transcriptional repressor
MKEHTIPRLPRRAASSGTPTTVRGKQTANAGVARAVALLGKLAALDRDATLTELASSLALSRSVAYKLLHTMIELGVVDYDSARQAYRPGVELYRLSTLVLQKGSFLRIARNVMRDLTARTGESTCLNLLDRTRDLFTVAAVEESNAPLQYVIELGQWHPLHAGASGKAILAFAPPAMQSRVLQRRLAAVTTNTIVNARKLKQQLEEIRRDGYCLSMGERLIDARGIAAPIRDHSGFSIGSVQFTIPEHRFDRRRVAALAREVIHAADRIGMASPDEWRNP